MTEADFTWTVPVELQLPCGLTRRFTNAYDAFDFLDAEWPTRRGQPYEHALKFCRNALRGAGGKELARTAFLMAAQDVGMRQCNDPSRRPSFLPGNRTAA